MRVPKKVTRFFESLLNQPGPVVRYLLPVGTLFVAICVQLVVAQFVRKGVDFPYTLFFLIAIFVTAWFGGYVPGVIACLITMVGIPLLATPGFRIANVDPSRLILLSGISALISLVAQSQRKKRRQLREVNDELERRVQSRTQQLELEILEHKSTEQRLQTQLERLNLLGQITRAIGERQDLRSIFQVVIRSLEDSLPIDFGCVCLYDAQAAGSGGHLRGCAERGARDGIWL